MAYILVGFLFLTISSTFDTILCACSSDKIEAPKNSRSYGASRPDLPGVAATRKRRRFTEGIDCSDKTKKQITLLQQLTYENAQLGLEG